MITAILGAEDVAGVPYPPLQKSSGEKVKEWVVQSAFYCGCLDLTLDPVKYIRTGQRLVALNYRDPCSHVWGHLS